MSPRDQFVRSVSVVALTLCVFPATAQKKSERQEPADSVSIWKTQAVEFEQVGDLASAEKALSNVHLFTGGIDVLKDRARVRQAAGDSVGCCRDLRECMRAGEEWRRRYDGLCMRKDSVPFTESGLSPERFSGITRVRRIRYLEEGGLYLGLIGAGDTVRTTLMVSDGDTLFTMADEAALFPGGMKMMYAYMTKNQRYPDMAYETGIQGKVYVKFTVGTDGLIHDITLRHSTHPLLDEEALRIVRGMPAWTPARYRGEPVPFRVTLPIVFRLM